MFHYFYVVVKYILLYIDLFKYIIFYLIVVNSVKLHYTMVYYHFNKLYFIMLYVCLLYYILRFYIISYCYHLTYYVICHFCYIIIYSILVYNSISYYIMLCYTCIPFSWLFSYATNQDLSTNPPRHKTAVTALCSPGVWHTPDAQPARGPPFRHVSWHWRGGLPCFLNGGFHKWWYIDVLFPLVD